jgi:RES domain-containing protein
LSFPVVYTALDEVTLAGEVERTLSRGAVTKPGHRVVARIRVRFSRVLDLTDAEAVTALGLTIDDLTSDDIVTTRELGEAANYLGYEAILAPSATGLGTALAILLTNRAASSEVLVVASAEADS